MGNLLGQGNHGEAWLLDDDTVLKLTNDRREYAAALCIKGHQNRHIIDIYDCWQFPDKDGEYSFAIKEEFLQMRTSSISDDLKEFFMRQLKHSWYELNKQERIVIDFRYWDVAMKAYAHNETDLINRMEDVFCEQTMSTTQASTLLIMLKETHSAVQELHHLCPTGELDFNSGNIGFTPDGCLKYFDILCRT